LVFCIVLTTIAEVTFLLKLCLCVCEAYDDRREHCTRHRLTDCRFTTQRYKLIELLRANCSTDNASQRRLGD